MAHCSEKRDAYKSLIESFIYVKNYIEKKSSVFSKDRKELKF